MKVTIRQSEKEEFFVSYFAGGKLNTIKFYHTHLDIEPFKPVILRDWKDGGNHDIVNILDTSWCINNDQLRRYKNGITYAHARALAEELADENYDNLDDKTDFKTLHRTKSKMTAEDLLGDPSKLPIGEEKRLMLETQFKLNWILGSSLYLKNWPLPKNTLETISKSRRRHQQRQARSA